MDTRAERLSFFVSNALRNNLSGTKWKLLAGATVLVSSTFGLMQINTTSGPPDAFVGALYRSVLLFVLNPSGLPTDGPALWLSIVWFDYFAAAALSLSLVAHFAKTVHEELRGPIRRARRMRGHVVICGYGKHGAVIAETILKAGLARTNREPELVIVERDASVAPHFVDIETSQTTVAHVPVVHGDMREPSVRKNAGVQFAAQVFVASGDDVTNLSVALHARLESKANAVALVSDAALTEHLVTFASAHGVTVLNFYAVAARNLVTDLERRGTLFRDMRSEVVIAGFGRFGQMFARAVEQRAAELCAAQSGAARHVTLRAVDRDATGKVASYAQRSLSALQPHQVIVKAFDGDISNIEHYVAEHPERVPTVVICTDNDATNLNLALALAQHPEVKGAVVTRFFERIGEFEVLGSLGVHPFSVGELFREQLPEDCFAFLDKARTSVYPKALAPGGGAPRGS